MMLEPVIPTIVTCHPHSTVIIEGSRAVYTPLESVPYHARGLGIAVLSPIGTTFPVRSLFLVESQSALQAPFVFHVYIPL